MITNDNTDNPGTSDHTQRLPTPPSWYILTLEQDRFCLGCLRVLKYPLSGPTCISCDRVPRLQESGAMNHPPKLYCIVCAKRAMYPAIVCKEHYEKQDSLREFEIDTLRALPEMCNQCGKCEKESSEKEFCNRCQQARRIEYHQAVLAQEQVPKGRPPK